MNINHHIHLFLLPPEHKKCVDYHIGELMAQLHQAKQAERAFKKMALLKTPEHRANLIDMANEYHQLNQRTKQILKQLSETSL